MTRALIYAGLVACSLVMSYGFAMLGEPSSAWLWGDVLGLL